MARPLAHGLEWFRHDTDAATDEKVETMRHLYGNDGYAFYFIMLERIYRTETQELDIADDDTRLILARKVGVSCEAFDRMVGSAIRYGLFDDDAYQARGILTSPGIKARAESAIEHRDRARDAAQARREANARKRAELLAKQQVERSKSCFGNNPDSFGNNEGSCGNNGMNGIEWNGMENTSREREAREAPPVEIDPNNPQHQPPDIEAIVAYGATIGKDRAACEAFHANYGSQGWHKANGRPVTHWPLLLRSWAVEDAAGQSPRKPRGPKRADSPPTPTIADAWWVWSYETAADRAAKEGVADHHHRWTKLRGTDGKLWFCKPENLSRGLPTGFAPWGDA